MSFSLIAAIGQNRELGKKGGLCFNLPGDLKHFKTITMGHPVFMGLNTWRSLPGKLPGRDHFVLTFDPATVPEDVTAITDLDQFIAEGQSSPTEIFVIGGAMVYDQMLPHCDKLYLTEVAATCPDADVFFPEFNPADYTVESLGHGSDNGINYEFKLYQKGV